MTAVATEPEAKAGDLMRQALDLLDRAADQTGLDVSALFRKEHNRRTGRPSWCESCDDGTCVGYHASGSLTVEAEDGKEIVLTLTAETDPYVAPHVEVAITKDPTDDPLAFAYLDAAAVLVLGKWADSLGRMAESPTGDTSAAVLAEPEAVAR